MNAFSKTAGFTLIEMMLVVAVLAALMAIALPNFTKMVRNSEISAAAESVANGLQRARAEAVSRNAKMQFVLGTGTSWTVDYVTKPDTTPAIDSRPSTDSKNATVAVTPLNATTVTFNQLGQVIANPDGTATLTQFNFNAPEGYRTLRVTLGAGGNARVCDPMVPSTNVRAC